MEKVMKTVTKILDNWFSTYILFSKAKEEISHKKTLKIYEQVERFLVCYRILEDFTILLDLGRNLWVFCK